MSAPARPKVSFRLRGLDRALLGLGLIFIAWSGIRTFPPNGGAVIVALFGAYFLLTSIPRSTDEVTDVQPATSIDPKPIEPDDHGSVSHLIGAFLILFTILMQIEPLSYRIPEFVPVRLIPAHRFAAPPLRAGDWVLVDRRLRTPREGDVVWVGRRRRLDLPQLVTVAALGPDTCRGSVRFEGGVTRIDLRDAAGLRRLEVTGIPEGAMRVAAHRGRMPSDPDWVVLPADWCRGIGMEVVYPGIRSLRRP